MAVGIKDVARIAGVSPATVSRTLSGRAVDPEMRARVERAVAETGYRPNLAARRLRSKHTNTIGLIVADLRNPFFTAVGRAVEDAAYGHGLRVILCNTSEDPDKETLYLRLMQEERVTGVIFAPTRHSAERLAREPQDYPVVMIDRSVPTRLHDAVVLDNGDAAATLVDHLHARGYRRITGLFGASTTGVERRAGYAAAIARHGLAADARSVEHGAAPLAAELTRVLARRQRPEALLASNGLMLLETMRALNAAGVGVPADLAVAGFDNEPWMELVAGGLTVIEQPVDAIGKTAMAMLLERLDDASAPSRKIVLGGKLVARGSTPAI
ncbi:MAG: LacI family transcriptional regulator [Deltaproteobacteria bacterium]|nr:LacI family transcriptional regulator [Deltaproteobacteria bacterium]